MWLDLHLETEFFHTPSMVAYADVIVEGHRETWPIRGSCFRAWLRRQCYIETGEVPSAGATRAALTANRTNERANIGKPPSEQIVRVVMADGGPR